MPDTDVPARRAGVRRAPKSSRPRRGWRERLGLEQREAAGNRALRPDRRRTRSLGATLGMTVLGAILPGTGYLYAGRRALGAVVLLAWLAVLGGSAWYVAGRGVDSTLDLAFDPTRLRIAAAVLAAGLLVWAFVVFTSYRLVRPPRRPRWHTALGNAAVAVLCLAVAVPVTTAARASMAHADFVGTVFDDQSATTPKNVTEKDPWGGQDRVNVLLLGGDGGEGRTGIRTDTVILASMNTNTGRTLMFSLPRNMMNAQFPEDSPLHDEYPDGYSGYEDDGYYMLNAIYGQIPERHPGVLGQSDNEGADAIKQAVSGSLGVPVHYYVLVNLAGFREVVDAMGGVTVNINEPVAIEGNTDLGIPPKDYLDPGPDQHLDGYHALWFARGRWGSDDYERMERQRCMVDALIEAADPVTLLTHYRDIAKAGKEVVYTDIPLKLAPAFAELALKVKDAKVKSVVFRSSERFSSSDPDFEYMQRIVRNSINPPERKSGKKKPPREAVEPVDACAYAPEDENVEAGE